MTLRYVSTPLAASGVGVYRATTGTEPIVKVCLCDGVSV